MNTNDENAERVTRIRHDAMATTFELRLCGLTPHHARQAAQAAFDELDRIEDELSRFIPHSDIARINALRAGQAIRVGIDAFDCLMLARRVWRETNGAFDVTVGALLSGSAWRPPPTGPGLDHTPPHPARAEPAQSANTPPDTPSDAPPPARPDAPRGVGGNAAVGMDGIELDPQGLHVGVTRDGITIDLGGIGKGYALDRMADLLREWQVPGVTLHSGESTVLVVDDTRSDGDDGGKPVSVALRDPVTPDRSLGRVFLTVQALSGSGQALRGQHILDPATGRPPQHAPVATWAVAPSAAWSDALSTAFMVMPVEQVQSYCRRHREVTGIMAFVDGGQLHLEWFGPARFERA